MLKTKTTFVCQNCGANYHKWQGKCDDCGSWNSIVEEIQTVSKGVNLNNSNGLQVVDLQTEVRDFQRLSTNINEFDRVLGGGLVEGSAILIGGDPGIGKSTLLLQLAITLTANDIACLYISGEESCEQIILRARRLYGKNASAKITTATLLRDIIAVLNKPNPPQVVVIDSIQTIYHDEITSAPGTVAQVKACAFELTRIAKARGITVIFVGHVTKDGQLAGPKVLEHMVDTVLYFEGDKGQNYRILRTYKNRFGATNEIGVFEMQASGLQEVHNPSAIFLSEHGEVSGTCIYAGIEGTRPILLEVQALIVPSFIPTPRRAVVGWDHNRLAMLVAVLNARYGLNLLDKEIYLNITGGLKITEPAADLAVVAALISAALDFPINRNTVFFGEVGLSGEVRDVVQAPTRMLEAEKLGFSKVVSSYKSKNKACNIQQFCLKHISELKKIFMQ
jgi:DNA repair protein RadA/Sms